MQHDKVTPYKTGQEKSKQVAQMFDNIAGRYDFLNSLLSLGIHKGWRKKCVELLRPKKPRVILDVATGTGDFALECARLKPEKIIGIDISQGMLDVGNQKMKAKSVCHFVQLKKGDAETITFPDETFDAIVVGFGVRNFQNLEKGLSNLYRMLKPGGALVILEFSYPTNSVVKSGYNFYFSFITPLLGKLFSKDQRAYSYLTESVKAFPNNDKFVGILQKQGYRNSYYKTLSLGVAAIYYAEK